MAQVAPKHVAAIAISDYICVYQKVHLLTSRMNNLIRSTLVHTHNIPSPMISTVHSYFITYYRSNYSTNLLIAFSTLILLHGVTLRSRKQAAADGDVRGFPLCICSCIPLQSLLAYVNHD